MMVDIALQGTTRHRHRSVGVEVAGIHQDRGVLLAQPPEETLLGDPLRHPAHDPRAHPGHPTVRPVARASVSDRTPVAPFFLLGRQGFPEAAKHPSREPDVLRLI